MAADNNIFTGTYNEIELLERHILMLKIVKEHQPVGLTRLSEMLDTPKHKVRYSLRLLEKEQLIAATPEGAIVTDRYDSFMASLDDQFVELISYIGDVKSRVL